jgi:hypothetical protein
MTTIGARPIPTFVAVALVAVPILAVLVLWLPIEFQVVVALTPAFVLAVLVILILFPGFAGYVAARSTAPNLMVVVAGLVLAFPLAISAFWSHRLEPEVQPFSSFNPSRDEAILVGLVVLAGIAGAWLAKWLVERGHIVRGYIAGAGAQWLVLSVVVARIMIPF